MLKNLISEVNIYEIYPEVNIYKIYHKVNVMVCWQ